MVGCLRDGISMVVMTMGVILPMVVKAAIDPLGVGVFDVGLGGTARVPRRPAPGGAAPN